MEIYKYTMRNKFNKNIKKDFIVNRRYNSIIEYKQFKKDIKTKIKYNKDELQELLFMDTSLCEYVYETFIHAITKNYIKDLITEQDINLMKHNEIFCDEKYDKILVKRIYDKFIDLILTNIEILDFDKKVYICLKQSNLIDKCYKVQPVFNEIKPPSYLPDKDSYEISKMIKDVDSEKIIETHIVEKTTKNKKDDTDTENDAEDDVENDAVDDGKEEDAELNYSSEEEEESGIINEIELDEYTDKKIGFSFRKSQTDAINSCIHQNFKSGIHHQIMGAGKSILMLNIIKKHCEKYGLTNSNMYIVCTDRIEIFKSWFFINLTQKFENEYNELYKKDVDAEINMKNKEHILEKERLIEFYDYEQSCYEIIKEDTQKLIRSPDKLHQNKSISSAIKNRIIERMDELLNNIKLVDSIILKNNALFEQSKIKYVKDSIKEYAKYNYTVQHCNNTYGYNIEKFKLWKTDGIIDMNEFNIVENVISKDKISDEFKKKDKPIIYIVNNSYLKAGNKYKMLQTKNIGLILVDECHSVSGNLNYEMLKYFRDNNISIMGFSATPLRPTVTAKKQLIDIYGYYDEHEEKYVINMISNYDMIQALTDEIVLPFVHVIIVPKLQNKGKELLISSSVSEEQTLNKIINHWFKTNPDLPFKKGVCWANSISKIAKDKGSYYNALKFLFEDASTNLDSEPIKLYTSYSGNKTYSQVNELDEFEKEDNHALLLCVNRVKEGSDIKNLDCGIFIDAVKNRGIVSALQSMGRIMRPDKEKLKKYALIIECVKLTEKKSIEGMTVERVLKYYKQLINIGSFKDSGAHVDKLLRLHNDIEIIDDDRGKYIQLNLENGKKCRINLEVQSIDWTKFQDKLRNELKNSLKIGEEEMLKREYMILENKVQRLHLKNKNEYIELTEIDKRFEKMPEIKYAKYWTNYYEFLKIDMSEHPKTKKEWKDKCLSLGIRTEEQYMRKWHKYGLPEMADERYKGFGDVDAELHDREILRIRGK